MAERPYSVTEVTRAVRQSLETAFPVIWVVGELSQHTLHTSGHRYFSLKDESSQLKCVMFRSQRPSGFEPEPGMQVLAQGRLTVYERSGQYQLNVSQLFQAGQGQQQLALEELKLKLMEEGLFDQSRKRTLPTFPFAIGVVTSRTGAAIRDILNVLERRFPGVRIVLRPALVQGEGAPEDVARGIEELNAYGKLDVLIVGRGGGAAEDLAAFNSERVVRAIAASPIPVISAVGHEVDITLSDLAADCRAPTPSAAAELAVRDASELLQRVKDLNRRALESLNRLLDENDELLQNYLERYGLRRVEDRLVQYMQDVDELQKDLQAGLRRFYEIQVESYRRLTVTLGTLSPLSVLGRGYSLTQRKEDSALVQNAASLKKGEHLRIRLKQGEILCTVDEVIP
ncbi:MAG: exodeoxyribonuclease VII large subunit [bacterium]|nr:exodeoxyribonuclease VII large subunit [bacterium]